MGLRTIGRFMVAGALAIGMVAAPRGSLRAAPAARALTLWLDWYPNTDHVGIYVALARGFYSQEGLNVEARVPSGAADAIRLVAHGTGDMGISYEPSVLLARQAGIPVIATAAIVQRPLNAILTLKSSHITSPRQLDGRTVAMAGEPSDYTDLQAVMRDGGGHYSSVKKLVVNYALLQALLSHKADAIIGAYWTWEALQAEQQGQPVNAMRLDQHGVPPYDELVLVTGKGQLAHEASALRAFQRATFRGYAYAAAHRAEATAILVTAPGVLSTSRSLILRSLGLLSPLFKDTQGRYGTMETRRWQVYADWMAGTHLLSGHVDASQAITQELLTGGV